MINDVNGAKKQALHDSILITLQAQMFHVIVSLLVNADKYEKTNHTEQDDFRMSKFVFPSGTMIRQIMPLVSFKDK